MVEIVTLDGEAVSVKDGSIEMIVGPYPHDVGPHTYVFGPLPKLLVTKEPPETLARRLKIDPALAQLTRPNHTSVWIKGAAVTLIDSPASTEFPGTKAVVWVGDLHQAVREDRDTARRIINEHGGRV
jgi:hypothetical protein